MVTIVRMFTHLACVALSVSLAIFAANVKGTVEDETKASVPNAVAILSNSHQEVVGVARSNEKGAFHILVAQPGDYLLTITHPGFQSYVTKVHVFESGGGPIVAILQISEKSERVDVTAESSAGAVSTDPAENRDAAVVGTNMLEDLPVFDQDYIGTLSSFLDQGTVGTLGTTIVVDGMEQKDAGVTPSAIQSVKINNDPYSAEYSRPGRGRIEITTKAAGSVFHGTGNFIFRDYHLNARDPFATEKPPEQRRIYEGVLTGPVGRSKKTAFLISMDHQEDNIQSIVVAQLLTGPLRENVPTPLQATDGAGRISHDFSDRHTASLQFTYEDQSGSNQLGSAQAGASGQRGRANQALGGDALPEAGYNFDSLERHLTFSDRFTFSPNLLNQFQLTYERNRDSTTNVTNAPQINVQGAFVGGGANAAQFSTENNIDVRDAMTWTHGIHTIVAGVAIPNMSRRALDDFTNRQGTFNFATLQDFQSGTPFSFLQQTGPERFVFWWREVGWFVQDQVHVNSNLTVAFGLRWDWQNYLHDNQNFAPRLSVAYAFGRGKKTVLRAGSGIFYDRTGQRPISSLVRYSQPAEKNLLIVNPGYPDPFLLSSPLLPEAPNVYRFNPNAGTPYILQYSAGLERQVLHSATVAATYRGAIGVSLFRSLDVNQPLPPLYLLRPDPSIATYQQVESSGKQVSNAIDLSFSGRLGRHISGLAQYTLSRTMNNTGGINYIPPNSYDLSGEWSRADFDQRNRFSVLMTSTWNRWLKLGVGFTAASGMPYTLTLGEDLYNTGNADARPPGVPRNSLEGPSYRELDVRWSHDFLLSAKGEKGPKLTFAMDAFDITNTVNYASFIGNERSPFFGHAIAALPPRRLQATLRFAF
jgi:Carboxypeptidase regulatory-like domain